MNAIEREVKAWATCEESWMAPLYIGLGVGAFFFLLSFFGG